MFLLSDICKGSTPQPCHALWRLAQNKNNNSKKTQNKPFVLFACFCDAELVNVATAHRMIVCVSYTNYVFVKCNGMVLSGRAADICWFISMGVFFIGRRGSLGLVQCPLLFLSANEESIFKVAMETIVFVVTAIGAAGRARFCYFCHESTPDTHACMPPCLCASVPAHTSTYVFWVFFCMNTDESRHCCWLVSCIWCSSHIKQYTGMCMLHPFFQCCQTSETSSPWQQ